ncbi:MAG: hypothetical protein PWQ57_912 [Desulfovibrionales bacterium]|jgi:hypothetical protein|nr:hypothetical protein [Desulfovibrionales bacterium]
MAEETKNTEAQAYTAFDHSFEDRFSGGDTVAVSYRFRRPTPQEVGRAQKQVLKDSSQAMRNLCIGCVHAEDKAKMVADFEAYPGLPVTMGTAIFGSIGVGSLGN